MSFQDFASSASKPKKASRPPGLATLTSATAGQDALRPISESLLQYQVLLLWREIDDALCVFVCTHDLYLLVDSFCS